MTRKFMVDFMLGRLCRWLRLIGEDAEYFKESDRGGIIYRSLTEKRIILTRDHRLSKKKALGLCLIMSDNFREQLKQVVEEFGLVVEDEKIFTRCTLCNTPIIPILKEEAEGKVPEYVYETQDEFSFCPKCSKIYWKGTHRELIQKVIGKI
jgi:uncharacterized protein with PIN domain